jgi:hypothetical protein
MRTRGVKPGLKVIKKHLSQIEALGTERGIIAEIGLDNLTNGNGGVSKITVPTMKTPDAVLHVHCLAGHRRNLRKSLS